MSLLLVVAAELAGCCAFSGPRHVGAPNDHFDGARFVNRDPTRMPEAGEMMRWAATREKGPWPSAPWLAPGPRPVERVGRGELRVTWVGHATVLVQIDGLNLLTDPIWSERATPVDGVGPSRANPAGIRFEDLPPIDAVLVSHDHYDHLDMPTLLRLGERHHPRFVVGLGNRELLEDEGLERVTELDWWDRLELGRGAAVSMVPAQHFSMRGLCDRDATLWGGYVLTTRAGSVYFAGDTGAGTHFAAIRERFGPPRLALLPIGAYQPRWVMEAMHMGPADAVEAHRVLAARTSVAVHFDTFPLADDGHGDAPAELAAVRARTGTAADSFLVPQLGFALDLP
ncbi:MAG: MBL fold metallo-hydrolase [Deltaproteobacteria bacterium]|nr:MBL fold metallo-hydrolase [Deltaproteobacteria bacterium]